MVAVCKEATALMKTALAVLVVVSNMTITIMVVKARLLLSVCVTVVVAKIFLIIAASVKIIMVVAAITVLAATFMLDNIAARCNVGKLLVKYHKLAIN